LTTCKRRSSRSDEAGSPALHAGIVRLLRMPYITVELRDEQGDPVISIGDDGAIVRLLPHAQDRSFVCWRFIREYDDTYFSAPQMPDFVAELERLREHASEADQESLNRIKAAAMQCERENLYMCLVGD
jgi:hypothetical protein